VPGAAWIDVREERRVAGRPHPRRGNTCPRGLSRVPASKVVVADKTTPIIVYCARGKTARPSRAKTLLELGYGKRQLAARRASTDWKRNGLRHQACRARLSPERRNAANSRHILIPEVGEEGQLKLLDSSVLLIGGGRAWLAGIALPGRGGRRAARQSSTPTSSTRRNLQRQIVHSLDTPRDAQRSTSAKAHARRPETPIVEVVPLP